MTDQYYYDYWYDKHTDIWYDSEGYAVDLEDIYGEKENDEDSDN
jgi:hypothetical protein